MACSGFGGYQSKDTKELIWERNLIIASNVPRHFLIQNNLGLQPIVKNVQTSFQVLGHSKELIQERSHYFVKNDARP